MRLFYALLTALVCAFGATTSATAKFYEARTDHFLLTIDATETAAREMATRLERFDAALRRLYGLTDDPDQHKRPIPVYELRAEPFHEVCGCPGILGFYHPDVAGSFVLAAHIPEADKTAKAGSWSSQVLVLHEYGHHFTFAHYPIAYPMWFSEGFAEFNANAGFEPDGSVVIGYPANYRAVTTGDHLSPKQVLAPLRFGFLGDPALIYERGWLLTHYLMLNPARAGQLSAYLAAVAKGEDSFEAGRKVFGDLNKLDAELEAYRRAPLAKPLRIPPGPTPTLVLRELRDGEAAVLPMRLLLRGGVRSGFELAAYQKVKRIADRYPDEPIAQVTLAQAAVISHKLDEADAAADRALAKAPADVEALDLKGQIVARRLRDTKDTDPTHWALARAWLLKANRADPDQVMPLYLFYRSFDWAKAPPTPGAIRGLRRAAVLAPESEEVRIALARQFLGEADGVQARALLGPVAYAPHHAHDEAPALKAIALIDAGKLVDARAALTDKE